MSIDTRPELSAPHHLEVDPELVDEIDAIDVPQTDFFRDLDSLVQAGTSQAVIDRAIHAYFHDIADLPMEEQADWWKIYFNEVIPQEIAGEVRSRWVGQVAVWMRMEKQDERYDDVSMTEREETIYARRGITEALDAQKRAAGGLPPRAPAWDSPVEPPRLARDGQR